MREVVLLQDNAPPHTAALTQLKLEQLRWKTLEHPPYSPDLSPCDFHVFGPIKRLWDVKGSTMMLGLKPMCAVGCRHSYEDGISELPIRWEKCVLRAVEFSSSD
jgi:hypothetical protein